MSSVLDTSIYINGVRLPNYSACIRDYEENMMVNKTLGGTIYVDFQNLRRTWAIKWETLFRTDFDVIYAFYLAQFQTNIFNVLYIPAYSISGPALLSISDQDIKFNGVLMKDFSLYVTEQYAFS